MDFNGPYSEFGGVYILLIVDCYSRFLIARPVKSTDFNSTRAVMEDVFDTYGGVKTIRTDNGPPFNGEDYKRYASDRGIAVTFSTPLDAQQNGGIETYMRLVNKGMSAPSVEGGTWRKSLAATIAAHNGATCSPTNKSPDELMFGRHVLRNLPFGRATQVDHHGDEEIRSRDWSHKMKHKRCADGKRDAKYSKIQVGDKVYVSRPNRKKGQTNFDPREFVVIAKKHGTLQLLSELGNVISRTTTFVKRVEERNQPRVQDDQNKDDLGLGEDQVRDDEVMKEPVKVAAEPQALRRSERLRKAPEKLKSYVCPLEDNQGSGERSQISKFSI